MGIIRFGQGDGVIDLFDPCIFTSQCFDAGTGNFNAGSPVLAFGPGNIAPPFVWLAQAGAEYDNTKVVYLSPQVYGFDFGLQYAPNEGNSDQVGGTAAGCTQAGPTCVSVTSGNDATRWLNQFGVGLRFQQSFGPVDVKAYGFYETAGQETLTAHAYVPSGMGAGSAFALATTGDNANSTQFMHYDDLSFYKAGVALTAANLTLAADYIGGRINGQLSMAPSGSPNMNAELIGLTYANGPITAGAEVGLIDSQGDARLTGVSQRHEYEIGFGGAYKLAPGVLLAAEYQYVHRHQGDFDFATGTIGL